MHTDWSKYSIDQIKTGTDEKGNRLLLAFNKEYREIFGHEPCHTCGSWAEKAKKFLNQVNTMSKVENSGYVLKKMYEGVTLEFGGNPISNRNLTDKIAKQLIEKHPKGAGLFLKIPEVKEKPNDDPFAGKKKADLQEWAKSLDLDDSGNVAELKARIEEKLAEGSQGKEGDGEGNQGE